MKSTLYILSALMIVNVTVVAQRAPSLSSPEVRPDNTITFRYYSRTAKKVSVNGEFKEGYIPLKKDTSGVWSVTVGPITPDIYPYSFMVDSVQVADPNNT